MFRLDANFDDDEDELSKWAIIARCLRGMRKQTRKLTARASAFAMAKKRSSLSLGKRYSLTSNKVHVQDNEIGVAETEVLADPVLPTATGIAHRYCCIVVTMRLHSVDTPVYVCCWCAVRPRVFKMC